MFRLLKTFALTSLFFLLLFTLPASSGTKSIPKPAYVRSGVGSLLLRTSHLALAKAEAGKSLDRRAAGFSEQSDTVRVLAIRVEFQPDDRSTTTGDGSFDLSTSSDAKLDPPPHDRAYFEAQLKALGNYYRAVSGGKLVILGDVYPLDANAAYRLPNPMFYYNPPEADQDEALRDRRLSELLRDAVVAADADTSVHFERYQSLVVFHAGVGQDFAFDFDPTPNDIPSVYLDRKTLAKALGDTDAPDTWQGIPVQNGNHAITDGIILPETQNQEGYDIALLGTACLMFGHQLGLPALYDTQTGRPGIGMWGLMDQGSGNLGGLVPAQPCAWSRVFLGWAQPVTVRKGQHLPVAAWQASEPHKIYKVPINSDEYFLVENRQRDPNGDGIVVGHDANGNRVEIRLMNDGTLRILPDGFQGVVVQLDDYDYGLPGSGILIWHVDESVLRAKLADNKVNTDPEHRAVDLEEADGAQDIGQQYGFLSAGSGAENGVPEDAFWAGNDINKLVNDAEEVAFTPWTEPNTDSYTGAHSHIWFTDFSDQDTVMHFTVATGTLQPGFPTYSGAPLVTPPVLADLDGDGAEEILAATEDGRLLCWRGDATPFLPGRSELMYVSATGDTTLYPDATVYTLSNPGTILTPAVVYDSAGAQIYWGTDAGQVVLLRPQSASGSPSFSVEARIGREGQAVQPNLGPAGWWADSLWFVVLPFSGALHLNGQVSGWDPTTGHFNRTYPVSLFSGTDFLAFASLGSHGFVALDATGRLYEVGPDFSIGWEVSTLPGAFSLGAADLDGDGSPEIVVLSKTGAVDAFTVRGERLSGFPTRTFGTCSAPLALGNVNGSGPLEIAFVTDEGVAVVLQHNGVLLEGWPVSLRGKQTTAPASPILVDVNGDGAAEVVVPTQEGGLSALAADGKPVAGFPFATAGRLKIGAAAGELDADNHAELVATGEDGFVYAWKLEGKLATPAWTQFKGNAPHSALSSVPGSKPTQPPGTTGLLPRNRVYCYPNPTAGNRATIRFTLTDNADVVVRIYDLSGTKVAELKAQGQRFTDNEIVWDVSGVASGVYLAKLEARSPRGTGTALIKIAVTR